MEGGLKINSKKKRNKEKWEQSLGPNVTAISIRGHIFSDGPRPVLVLVKPMITVAIGCTRVHTYTDIKA